MKCGVPSCRYRAKVYGVCGIHKTYAYISNDKEFQRDMKIYENLLSQIVQEDNELQSKGHDILEIESYLSKRTFPEHLKVAGKLIERISQFVAQMEKKYDPYLVGNAITRIQHSYFDCNCEICSLGK